MRLSTLLIYILSLTLLVGLGCNKSSEGNPSNETDVSSDADTYTDESN